MSRKLRIAMAALFIGASLASPIIGTTGSPAAAAATPAPDDSQSDSMLKATNAGTIMGTVTKVDYQKSKISVMTTMHGSVDVTVLPSTTIQGKSGFSEISDIAKGQKVTIFLSQKGDEKFAQIIQLQK